MEVDRAASKPCRSREPPFVSFHLPYSLSRAPLTEFFYETAGDEKEKRPQIRKSRVEHRNIILHLTRLSYHLLLKISTYTMSSSDDTGIVSLACSVADTLIKEDIEWEEQKAQMSVSQRRPARMTKQRRTFDGRDLQSLTLSTKSDTEDTKPVLRSDTSASKAATFHWPTAQERIHRPRPPRATRSATSTATGPGGGGVQSQGSHNPETLSTYQPRTDGYETTPNTSSVGRLKPRQNPVSTRVTFGSSGNQENRPFPSGDGGVSQFSDEEPEDSKRPRRDKVCGLPQFWKKRD